MRPPTGARLGTRVGTPSIKCADQMTPLGPPLQDAVIEVLQDALPHPAQGQVNPKGHHTSFMDWRVQTAETGKSSQIFPKPNA